MYGRRTLPRPVKKRKDIVLSGLLLHMGAHTHPHGSEPLVILLAALLLIGGVYLLKAVDRSG